MKVLKCLKDTWLKGEEVEFRAYLVLQVQSSVHTKGTFVITGSKSMVFDTLVKLSVLEPVEAGWGWGTSS